MQRATIAITGANGSIGTKLARFLLGSRLRVPQQQSSGTSPCDSAISKEHDQKNGVHLKLLDDYEGFYRGQHPRDPLAVTGDWVPQPVLGTFERVHADILNNSSSSNSNSSGIHNEHGNENLQKSDEQRANCWQHALEGVDTVIHLAAVNPCVYLVATSESALSCLVHPIFVLSSSYLI